MIDIVPTHRNDFDELIINDIPMTYAKAVLEGSRHAYTLRKNGKVLCILGVIELWTGVGQLWQYVSSDLNGTVLELIKTGRRVFREKVAEADYHRIHALVLHDPKYIRWAELFGFIHESNMYYAAPDKGDMAMMVYFPHRQGE